MGTGPQLLAGPCCETDVQVLEASSVSEATLQLLSVQTTALDARQDNLNRPTIVENLFATDRENSTFQADTSEASRWPQKRADCLVEVPLVVASHQTRR